MTDSSDVDSLLSSLAEAVRELDGVRALVGTYADYARNRLEARIETIRARLQALGITSHVGEGVSFTLSESVACR
jgi:hypothetical protein